MTSTRRLVEKLRDKRYREQFVAGHARRAIPYQIRAIMKARDISQQDLAERSGLTQGAVSRAANPTYGKMTLNTCIRVAAGLDVAFVGMFVPFSKLVDVFDRMSEDSLGHVMTFDEEYGNAEAPTRHDHDLVTASDATETSDVEATLLSAPQDRYEAMNDATQRGQLHMVKVEPVSGPTVADKSEPQDIGEAA